MWKKFLGLFTGNRGDGRTESLKRGWSSVHQQQNERIFYGQAEPTLGTDVQVLYVSGPSSKKSRLDPSSPSPKELEAWVTGSAGKSSQSRLYFQPRAAAGGSANSRLGRCQKRPNRHAHCSSNIPSTSGLPSQEFSFRAEMPLTNGDSLQTEVIDLTASERFNLDGLEENVTEDEDDPPGPLHFSFLPSTSQIQPRPSIHEATHSFWTSPPHPRTSNGNQNSPDVQFIGESKSSQCSPNTYSSIVSGEKLRGRARASTSKVSPATSPRIESPQNHISETTSSHNQTHLNRSHRKPPVFSASKYIDLESKARLSRIIPSWDDEGPSSERKAAFGGKDEKIDDDFMHRVKQLISSLPDGGSTESSNQDSVVDLSSELEMPGKRETKSPPPVITLDATEAEEQFTELGKRFENFDPKSLLSRLNNDRSEKERLLKQEERIRMEAEVLREQRELKERRRNAKAEARLNLQLRGLAIVEEIELEEEEEEEEGFPELDEEADEVIEHALHGGSPDELLVEEFRIPIHRKDIRTLQDRQWLNDEVINFYLNLVMARGSDGNHPKVYAFNTFFVPKLKQGGHGALKRWTRKVDIFAYDYLLIPVHLEVHWCMAVIDMKKKIIEYYDSMGHANNWLLNGLEEYLQAEHLDKKKSKLNTSDWEKVNMDDIPQQKNGSDCGMFACKFAEYASRGAKINFSQQDMPYFRRRMIYEIVTKRLM